MLPAVLAPRSLHSINRLWTERSGDNWTGLAHYVSLAVRIKICWRFHGARPDPALDDRGPRR